MPAFEEQTLQDDEKGNQDSEIQRFKFIGAQQGTQPGGYLR